MGRRALVNALTLLNAAAGVLAMIALALGPQAGWTTQQSLRAAALLITLGYLPDVLDGALARLLKVSSAVGAQLDVNADTTTFNLATALMIVTVPVYLGGAPATPSLATAAGLVAGLVYAGCGLYRSARLVVTEPVAGPRGRYFLGATTNVAALVTAGLVLVATAHPALAVPLAVAIVAQATLLGPLMVSELPFPDVPQHLLRGLAPRWPILALAGVGYVWGPELGWTLGVYGYALVPALVRSARGAPLR